MKPADLSNVPTETKAKVRLFSNVETQPDPADLHCHKQSPWHPALQESIAVASAKLPSSIKDYIR